MEKGRTLRSSKCSLVIAPDMPLAMMVTKYKSIGAVRYQLGEGHNFEFVEGTVPEKAAPGMLLFRHPGTYTRNWSCLQTRVGHQYMALPLTICRDSGIVLNGPVLQLFR